MEAGADVDARLKSNGTTVAPRQTCHLIWESHTEIISHCFVVSGPPNSQKRHPPSHCISVSRRASTPYVSPDEP